MNPQQAILKHVFNDEKERTVLGYTPFGDILFKEDEKNLFFALQIYAENGLYSKKNPFQFLVHHIGNNLQEYDNFIKQGGLFKEAHLPELYQKIFFRNGLYEAISSVKSKSNYEIYIADKKMYAQYETAEKIHFNDFCKLVLNY